MLPFQIEAAGPVGMTPNELALRQRQRMLQAGVFVCCLLLLLDTRATPPPSLPPEDDKESADSRMRARLDAALGATVREAKFANVTGLYQGKWATTARNVSSRKLASHFGADKGLASLHVEMIGVDGFSQLSVLRGLVSLGDESGGTDKTDFIFVSAFGVYFHSLGRLVMVANAGNPDGDLELRWTRTASTQVDRPPKALVNRTAVRGSTMHRAKPRPQHLRTENKSGGPPRRSLRDASDPLATLAKKSASVFASHVIDGLDLEVIVQTALPARSSTKDIVQRSNFTLAVDSPLVRANATSSLSALKKKAPADYFDDDRLDDDDPTSGIVALTTERPVGYPARPLGHEYWWKGRCSFLVDLEEDPTERKKISPVAKTKTDELALKLVGTISGCGLTIDVSTHAQRIDWDAARRAALGYSLLMTTTCVVQIALLFRQLHFSRHQPVAAGVSLLCVAAQSLIDAVLCVANLLLCAAVQNLFAAFAAVAFFELIIFCVVEMRYVVVVFQAHDPQRFWLGASTRRQLAILHAQFYFALFAALCAVYVSRDDIRLVTLVAYSFWIPQIVRNARFEYAQPFHDTYLYGMAVSRLVAPVYVYAYPYSLVGIIIHNAKLRPLFCLGLIAWQAAQVAVLKAQHKLGPRFFVPSCFLPARYDYRRPLPPPPPRGIDNPPTTTPAPAERGGTPASAPPPGPASRPPDPSASSSPSSSSSSPTSGSRCRVVPNASSASASPDVPSDRAGGADRAFECVICFQDVVPDGRNHLITPCDHVRRCHYRHVLTSLRRSSTTRASCNGCSSNSSAPSAGARCHPSDDVAAAPARTTTPRPLICRASGDAERQSHA